MTTAVKHITPCPPGFSDHVFKVEEGVEIPLRVWPAPVGAAKPAPWLLWIHGGAFTAGKHLIPNAWVNRAFAESGYHVVSAAYRFTPQAGMAEITQDCFDAFAWCRSHLAGIFGGDSIDIERYVVAGDSAGGTMATMLGHLLSPAPRAVIDVFGVVDMTAAHFHPSDESRKRAAEWSIPFHNPARTDDEYEAMRADRDLRNAEVLCPWNWELEPDMSVDDLRVFWGAPDFTPSQKDLDRMDLVYYNGKHQLLFATLMRKELFPTPEAWEAELRKWSTLHILDDKARGRGLGKQPYPPTFFLHGTDDHAVPVEQSYAMAEKLRGLGVPIAEAYHPGGEHCFDQKIEGPQDRGWAEYIVPCMKFVDGFVKA